MNTYDIDPDYPVDHYFPTDTMNDMLKLEILVLASKKFTLKELESRLGEKHDLLANNLKPVN